MFVLTAEDKQKMKELYNFCMAGGDPTPKLEVIQKQLEVGEITKRRFEWLCYYWGLRPQDIEKQKRDALEIASTPGF
jgi:hypothetical protein